MRGLGLVGLAGVVALGSLGCWKRREEATRETPAARERAPSLLRRLESGSAPFTGKFPYDELLPAPAFEVTLGPSKIVTVVFLRRAKGATSSARGFLGVIEGEKTHRVSLDLEEEGSLEDVEAFDLRDTDADGQPELLLLARFQPWGDPPPPSFRRGFQIAWSSQGKPFASLASHELRDVVAPGSIDALVQALAELRRTPHCPPLSPRMEAETTIDALRCMVDGGHKEQLAASVQYPTEVLLPGGEVRELSGPAQLLGVYDQVIDPAVREALRQGESSAVHAGMLLGSGQMIVSQSYYVTGTYPPVAPKILAFFSTDPVAHRRLSERLKSDQRAAWQDRPGEIVCRTHRATHVFYRNKRSEERLATWNDPKASTKTPPDRVLFGLLESHGTCGNDFYSFVGPAGLVKLTSVTCYGPDPTPKHAITDGPGEEPCLNHPILR